MILFMASCGFAKAQTTVELSTISADPERAIYNINMSNGVGAVFDYSTQRAYITYSRQIAEVTFQQMAAQKHPGDTAAQQDFINELNSQLSAENAPYTLTASTTPRLATDYSRFGPINDGPGDVIIQRLSNKAINFFDNVVPGLDGPCDLGPCTPSFGRQGRIFYLLDSHSTTSTRIGTKSPAEQQQFATDYDRYRGAVCGLGLETGAQVVAWGSAGTACGSLLVVSGPAMPPVAIGCGLAIGGGLIANGFKNRAERQCKASYKGPGKW